MNWLRLLKAEARKLTTTKLVWGFLAAAVVLSAFVLVGVLVGTQAGGANAFDPATRPQQLGLVAFGTNALLLGGLFGAVATAREYSHGTVVPTYLLSPNRYRALLAKLVAAAVAGALLGLVGAALSIAAAAVSLPAVDYEFVLSSGDIVQSASGSMLSGAVGALFGVGVGALLRNTGGAVTVIVVVLLLVPPLVAQLVSEVSAWVPATLTSVVSGVGDDPSLPAAIAALAAWGLVPAAAGVVAVMGRDVV